ncbi:zinc finger protein 570-like isoform X1 [Artemia franciscana]|uniref:zinc finger protein 570-like isoform X1 n=2 Tax=Artemia franciscana TaxID=6661 RepID=UPI0032DABEEE
MTSTQWGQSRGGTSKIIRIRITSNGSIASLSSNSKSCQENEVVFMPDFENVFIKQEVNQDFQPLAPIESILSHEYENDDLSHIKLEEVTSVDYPFGLGELNEVDRNSILLVNTGPQLLPLSNYCLNPIQPEDEEVSDPGDEEKQKQTLPIDSPYVCKICMRGFAFKSRLSTHMRSHTGEKPYECNVCKKTFSRCSHLTYHRRIHDGIKPFECDFCRKAFTQKTHLAKHLATHTGEKRYECELCQKKFFQISNFSDHMWKHTGEKPHECDICKKSFCLISQLTDHRKIHTSDRPYECTTCRRKFTLRKYLTTHARIHSDLKPYECETCRKKFNYKSQLVKHMATHTTKKA